ncbi:hypothetical protein MPLA_670116 [Mesorhizobium sp. ORS 3359]|nr:hypothetical protein MPLA_670116 [Mesorhizobium sp. ORS 3359]
MFYAAFMLAVQSAAHYPLWKTAPNLGDHKPALGQYRWNPVPLWSEPACSSRKPDKNVT